MNFSMTFSDEIGMKSAGIGVQAEAAVTKSLYEAIKYDAQFRGLSLGMLREGRHAELQDVIKGVLANEALRLCSDAMMDTRLATSSPEQHDKKIGAYSYKSLASMQSNAAWTERLAGALDMIDADRIDLIGCYREAYSRFEMEMDFYRELKRGSTARWPLRI